MHYNLLDDITVVDLTQRLPGPYASYILQSMGAHIIKIENNDQSEDFFKSKMALKHNPNLHDWYQNINRQKIIKSFSFKNNLHRLSEELSSANIIIAPHNSYFKNYFKNTILKKDQSLIYLAGGVGEWKNLHDLNALSFTKTFQDHLHLSGELPYLPIAGIGFAQYIATLCLALLRKTEKQQAAIEEIVYLKDVCIFLFDALYSKLTHAPHKFLHNGLYPCYQTYKTMDGDYVCLAAIEEKYWNNFIEEFHLPLNTDDRFDKSPKTYELIKNLFANINSHEIQKKIINKSLCLSITKA